MTNDLEQRIGLNENERIAYYQLNMLRSISDSPFCVICIGAAGNRPFISHDITGMCNLTSEYENRSLSRTEAVSLLAEISRAISLCSENLLCAGNIALEPERIYIYKKGDMRKIFLQYDPVYPVRDVHLYRTPNSLIEFLDMACGPDGFSEEEKSVLLNSSPEDPLLLQELLSDTKPEGIKNSSKFIKLLATLPFPPIISVIILLIQTGLAYMAFDSLRYFSAYANSYTPLLICVCALVFIILSDIFLLFHPAISLKDHLQAFKRNTQTFKKDTYNDEEKTVYVDPENKDKRIGMLCSGIPGTPEEAKSEKAIILTDDFIVGRDGKKADFKIDSLTIGRTHARILRKENYFFIEDMGSRNGTYVDGKKLKKNTETLLADKCRISFADKEYYFLAR